MTYFPSYSFTHHTQNHFYWLQLIRSQRIGPASFHQLLTLYSSIEEAIQAIPQLCARVKGKPPKLASAKIIEEEIHACEKFGAELLLYSDPAYPPLLKQIDYPPPVLMIYGDKTCLNEPCFAIVGTRHASSHAYRLTQQFAEQLTKNFVIVSGLARGIDTAAHLGALKKGKTIAVTACGIDQIYPPQNHSLYHQIAKNNTGAIVTEMPFGTPPKSANFPRRNRIISGLSVGTLVVEATLNSGSLITAHAALSQNREVFAIPGFPLDPRCKGPNSLLKQGAVLTQSVEDIYQALPDYIYNSFSTTHPPSLPIITTQAKLINDEGEHQEIHQIILDCLSTTPMDIDEISIKTSIPISSILTILLELELAGKIARYPGNKVALLFYE